MLRPSFCLALMEILSLIEEYENILCLIQDKYLLYKNQQLMKSISHSKISSLILRKFIASQHDCFSHYKIKFPKFATQVDAPRGIKVKVCAKHEFVSRGLSATTR